MKSAVAILVISCLVAVTYAAPSSTQLQQDDDDSARMKELIDLIDRAAKLQQDGDYDSAEAQFFKNFIRKAGGFWRKHGRGIMKGAGRFAGGVLGGLLNQGGGPGYGAPGGGYANAEAQNEMLNDAAAVKQDDDYAFEQDDDYVFEQDYGDDDLMAAIESLPEKAQVQLFGLIKNLLGKLFG